ncbi:hypothetical protein Dsin_028112 [Dipteronia sinensis]|uniref:Pectinesterase inhibitor domain-containing protein n=1 Tax=Dipteronia sinensis TaxID=43782 RepID=A0AAD9ZRF7_9ROSI|nr:hypothetical protein Dsin_028112 [Dipteronia sinensis]
MEPKYNNQILIIFLFSSLTLFNHVTQAIFVVSNSIHTTTSLSTTSSPQQQPVPPPQTDISSLTPATNQPENDISTPTPTANPPETDILAPSPAANPQKLDISAPTPTTNPSETDILVPTPAANSLEADISSPTPTINPPETDILAPTPAANPPNTDISAPTQSKNPPNTDISSPTPAVNPPETDISSPNQSPDQSQGATNIFHPRDPLPPNSKIKHICESTDYPSLCWPYISTFYSGKSDATTVLEMAINATAQQIKMAQSALASLAKDPKFLSDKKNSNLLDDCKEMYDDALDNLQSARDAIPKRDIITVNIMLSAALTDFSTCADGFTGKNSPVGGIDNKLKKLVSNCLAISSLVKK